MKRSCTENDEPINKPCTSKKAREEETIKDESNEGNFLSFRDSSRNLFKFQINTTMKMIEIERQNSVIELYWREQHYNSARIELYNVGKLNSRPGSGKTLMILNMVNGYYTRNKDFGVTCIVVPNNLVTQWAKEIRTIANFVSCNIIQYSKSAKVVADAKVVVVSSNVFANLHYTKFLPQKFSRIFFDEHDSVVIPLSSVLCISKCVDFCWYVSGTNEHRSLRCLSKNGLFGREFFIQNIEDIFDIRFGSDYYDRHVFCFGKGPEYDGQGIDITPMRHAIEKRTVFYEGCPRFTIAKKNYVVECPTSVIEEEVKLQTIVNDCTILYKPVIKTGRFGLTYEEILRMIYATGSTTRSILESVIKRHELEIADNDLKIEARREAGALTRIDEERNELRNRDIRNIIARIEESIKNSECIVCYDVCEPTIITACCQTTICPSCIVKLNGSCPKCRQSLVKTIKEYRELSPVVVNEVVLLNATDTMKRLIESILLNKDAKILLIGTNTFYIGFLGQIPGCRARHISGQAVSVANSISKYFCSNDAFDSINVLVMDTTIGVAGHDLQNTTDIIFPHSFQSQDLETQAIGRALRIGRTAPCLNIHRLVESS
jgi:hypothetical protein